MAESNAYLVVGPVRVIANSTHLLTPDRPTLILPSLNDLPIPDH